MAKPIPRFLTVLRVMREANRTPTTVENRINDRFGTDLDAAHRRGMPSATVARQRIVYGAGSSSA